jgi:hypothetical protein
LVPAEWPRKPAFIELDRRAGIAYDRLQPAPGLREAGRCAANGNPGMMLTKIVHRIADIPYVRKAIEERADLSAFRKRPTARILCGVSLIGFSYLIGWPAVAALGVLALYLEEPLVALVGGPLIYGISHLVFIAGMYLAGAEYSAIFLRWATRVVMEKLIK